MSRNPMFRAPFSMAELLAEFLALSGMLATLAVWVVLAHGLGL